MEHGFFYVSNHGVDGALLDTVFAESRSFFEQPLEGKMALLRDSNHQGYIPRYAEKLDAALSSQVGFLIGRPAFSYALCTMTAVWWHKADSSVGAY